MSLNWSSGVSIRNQWAREHAKRGIKELWNERLDRAPPHGIPGVDFPGKLKDGELLPELPDRSSGGESTYPITDAKVAIVGAGAAGLFTGMILDYLNNNEDLKKEGFHVSYEILEAACKDRVGGRLFTYNFKARDSSNPQGPHDYYDVGAMRFPDNPVMKRLFDLFKTRGMEKRKLSDNPPAGSLVPYYIQNKDGEVNEPWCYNSITKWGDYEDITAQDQANDPFRLNRDNGIPESIITSYPDDVINKTIEPLREALRKDLDPSSPGTAGWDMLMKYDRYSTRQFLGPTGPNENPGNDTSLPPYNYETIEFLETFNGGTNWYDQAHSETVLESLDFEYYDSTDTTHENTWWCVLGGAQQLALRMEESLKNKPEYLSRVTAIQVKKKLVMEIDIEKPTCGGGSGKEKRQYNGVFNSTTLGCLKRIDTRTTNLSYPIQQGTRSLGYGPSAKVGIKFKRAWWIYDLPEEYRIKKGGLGHSDLHIRTCVYPSYNIDEGKPAVLLCSYTWQQDAERIGALMSSSANHSQQLKDEADLRELLFRDLARLHTYDGTADTEAKIYKLISDNYLDHYAHDWTHDPNTVGAFAFFRPQQFSNVWNKMIHPTGNLIVIGEATSPHHAWVVGALESAVHGLHYWLDMRQNDIKGAKAALGVLAKTKEGIPFVGLPPYMEEPTANWGAFLGNLAEDEYIQGSATGRGPTTGQGSATGRSLGTGKGPATGKRPK